MLCFQDANAQFLKNKHVKNGQQDSILNIYFEPENNLEITPFSLFARDDYALLSLGEKETLMAKVVGWSRDSIVLVKYDSKIELWSLNSDMNMVKLIDEIDLEISTRKISTSAVHRFPPWFFYIGGQMNGDIVNETIFATMSLNTRLGFFLLLNKWDFATTLSTGTTGSIDTEGDVWVNLGLMSRVHSPIKILGVIPSIGIEYSNRVYGENPAVSSTSWVLGISKFIGVGSIDFAYKWGETGTIMGGYTISSGMRNLK